MSLRVYNTLSKQKELFEPVRAGQVGIYLCGPTVYKPPHMGHMVGPVIFDAVKRYLAYKGFDDDRSEEHTSELQSQSNLVCRLLLENKNIHLRHCVRGHALGHVLAVCRR